MEEIDVAMSFTDINGDSAVIHVHKVGGGILGRKYDGNWKIWINGPYGETEVIDFSSGIPENHFDVAIKIYGWYLEDGEQ